MAVHRFVYLAQPVRRIRRGRLVEQKVLLVALILVAMGVVGVVHVPPARAVGAGYTALSPARLLDTRPGGVTVDGVSAGGGAIGPGSVVAVTVTGRGGVPSVGVAAVALNITAVSPSATGFTTVWPTGQSMPNASNLNWVPGDVAPNMVIVKVGLGGKVSIFNSSGSTHYLVDVVGWFDSDGIQPITPARVLDTRAGGTTIDGSQVAQGSLGAGQSLGVQIAGRGGVPSSGVTAVAVNVTAVTPSVGGFTTVWPSGEAMPNASNLNWASGVVVPNLVVAKIGIAGAISVFNSGGSTHYLIDVVGYFTSASGFVPVSPARLADTRGGGTIDGLNAESGVSGGNVVSEVRVVGRGGVLATGVGSVIVNVTAVSPLTSGYATVFPTGETLPNASSLNFTTGFTKPNLVLTKLGVGGKITIFTSSADGVPPNYLVDVVGYFPGITLGPIPTSTAVPASTLASTLPEPLPTSTTRPAVTTTTAPAPALCAGGTRVEAETAVDDSGSWLPAVTPAGYSGAGFASDVSGGGYVIASLPLVPDGFYDVYTRDITGGSGATREIGSYPSQVRPFIWPVHNDWGITSLGPFSFSSNRSFSVKASGSPDGYLGIDFFDFCPVTQTPMIQIAVGNSTDQIVAIELVCHYAGQTFWDRASLAGRNGPVPGQHLTVMRPLGSSCDFNSSTTGASIRLTYWSQINARYKDNWLVGLTGPLFLANGVSDFNGLRAVRVSFTPY